MSGVAERAATPVGEGRPGAGSNSTLLAALVVVCALTLIWNGLLYFASLWRPLWWLALAGNFVLLVIAAERAGRSVPPAWRKVYERTLALGFPLLALAAWQLIVDAGILNPLWFPQPTKIAAALWDLTVHFDRFSGTTLFGRPWLIPSQFEAQGWPGVWNLFAESHVWVTLARVGAGFIIGTIPGILLGVVMGINRTVRLMLDTTLSAIYVLPKIAIFPIVMLMFADPFGEGPKVAVVALSVFFLMTINTMAAVRDIDPVFLMAGRNYGARGFALLRHVIIPAAMPVIFAGLRLALGTALIVIISVEFLRAKQGVGFMTFYYWEVLNPEKMYAGLAVVMALGIVLTYGLQALQRSLMPWQR
jgi:NitT/TauT family transport system permease protein